jgi:hypothetical protein
LWCIFFVSTIEVIQLIISNVFLDQGTTLFNLQLCLVDYVDGSNNNFAILVCGLNHRWKYLGLFIFYSCASKCNWSSWSSWMMCMCKHRYNWCYQNVKHIHEKRAPNLRTTKEIIKVDESYLWLLCIALWFWCMLLRIWYEFIAKKLLHERMCKLTKFWSSCMSPFGT